MSDNLDVLYGVTYEERCFRLEGKVADLERRLRIATEALEKIAKDEGMCGAWICKDAASAALKEIRE